MGDIIFLVIIGAAAGLIGIKVRKMELSLPVTIAVSVIGALIGELILSVVLKVLGVFSGLIGAVLGAMALLWAWRRYGAR